MTAIQRIGLAVLVAMVVAAILTLFGMSHGQPAAAGAVAGVIVQTVLRARAKKTS